MASILRLGSALPWSQLQWVHQSLRAMSLGSISEFSTVAVASVSEQSNALGQQVTSQASTSGRGGWSRRKVGEACNTAAASGSTAAVAAPPLRKVSTSEPWPWVVPMLPQVLPKLIKPSSAKRVPLLQAVKTIKANADARRAGIPPQLTLSGRPRPQSNPDESVEIILNFLTDPRKSDQVVRGVVSLPHGSGRRVRVAAFCTSADADAARAAGADVVGGEELITAIIESEGAAINFDRLVAVPAMMKPLARAGRVLGPLGLMPNPKMGTLTPDIAGAVREMLAGRVEFRVSPKPILQLVVGKASFPVEHLCANVGALMAALLEARPPSLPGNGVAGYIQSMYLKTSMTPAVAVDLPSAAAAATTAAQQKTTPKANEGGQKTAQKVNEAGRTAAPKVEAGGEVDASIHPPKADATV